MLSTMKYDYLTTLNAYLIHSSVDRIAESNNPNIILKKMKKSDLPSLISKSIIIL